MDVLRIDRSGTRGYDPGTETFVYVIQEFKDDFLDYVKYQDLDPEMDQFSELWEETTSDDQMSEPSQANTNAELYVPLPGTLEPQALNDSEGPEDRTACTTTSHAKFTTT